MSDDWQPGDLAECVRPETIYDCKCGRIHRRDGLRRGQVFVVLAISSKGNVYCTVPVLEFAGGQYGSSQRFRKIRPHTPDAEDAETIALLKGGRVPA